MKRELSTTATGLWIIGCVLVTVICAYAVYTSITAEPHEQCIDQTSDRTKCWEFETDRRNDDQIAILFSLIGTFSLAFTVHLIWKEMKIREAAIHLDIKTRQPRNVTPTPWWAFWCTANLIWKARKHRNVTPTPWWAFWR